MRKDPALADTDPNRPATAAPATGGLAWQTVRLLAACAGAYALAWAAGLKEAYWAIITAVVVTQPAWADTLVAARNRILGTLLGAATGFLVLEGERYGLPGMLLFWLALVPLAILTAAHQNMRLSCITLVVIVLIPAAGPPFLRPLDRVFGILLGVAASLVSAALIRPAALRTTPPLRQTAILPDESQGA